MCPTVPLPGSLRKGTNQYATPATADPPDRLVACGTRAVIDAAFGPCTRGETVYGQHLMRCLHENMIVLLDAGLPPALPGRRRRHRR